MIGWVASACATMSLMACSGGSGDSPAPTGPSKISISLMDAPVDGVTAVYVKITSMWIKPQGGPAVQLPLTTTPMTVNLMELTDKNAAILINEAVIEPPPITLSSAAPSEVAAARARIPDRTVVTDNSGFLITLLPVVSGRS